MRTIPYLSMLLALVAGLAAPAPAADFIRGDANQDGSINITDPIATLNFLFQGMSGTCLASLDADDDGGVDITDAIYELYYLFMAGPPIPQPFPGCGPAPATDMLGCASFDTRACAPPAGVVVRGISPRNGPVGGGTHLAIDGTGFSAANLQVTLCGRPLAGIVATGDTRIEGDTPAAAAPGPCDLMVTTANGEAVIPGAFRYDAAPNLSISGVSPKTGHLNGGTHIAVGGAGFTSPGLQAFLGTDALLNLTVVSDVRLEGDAPGSAAPQTVALRVAAGGSEAIFPSAFTYQGGATKSSMLVLAWNDLGMHCMNQDFSELMILPPHNVLKAQVVQLGGEDPRLVTNGIDVSYSIPNNTACTTKTNFWSHAKALLGMDVAPDKGLFGFGLSGSMVVPAGSTDRHWEATGIPITPIQDTGQEDPYQLARVTVKVGGSEVARTDAVVPVSWEISCDLCHDTPGITVATDILRKHDALHATTLEQQKPVLCGGCHGQPPLGLPGKAGVPTLSSSMHSAHASRMDPAGLSVPCYACHPGVRTKCLRDIHFAKGMVCMNCHGQMRDVGDPARKPWADEPRCGSAACHTRAGFQFEQTGTLYRNSIGHHGVMCGSCHGSPHAITPTLNGRDNLQSISLQGQAGPIAKYACICHGSPPEEGFSHRLGGD